MRRRTLVIREWEHGDTFAVADVHTRTFYPRSPFQAILRWDRVLSLKVRLVLRTGLIVHGVLQPPLRLMQQTTSD